MSQIERTAFRSFLTKFSAEFISTVYTVEQISNPMGKKQFWKSLLEGLQEELLSGKIFPFSCGPYFCAWIGTEYLYSKNVCSSVKNLSLKFWGSLKIYVSSHRNKGKHLSSFSQIQHGRSVKMRVVFFLFILSMLPATPSLPMKRGEGRKNTRKMKTKGFSHQWYIHSLYSCLYNDCTQRIFEHCSQREACLCIYGLPFN